MPNRKRIKVIAASFCLVAYMAAVAFRTEAPKSKAELGKLLFEEKMLSLDSSISCASCHIPAFAFADTAVVSTGVNGSLGLRNTPSVMNMASRTHFFWDGRANSLAEQALGPIENPIEMNLPIQEALDRLNQHSEYKLYFRKVFRDKATAENLGEALAAFQETLETSKTPFDRWMSGDSEAMTPQQIAGRNIFMEKGKCFDCHFGPDFTGDEFRNIGLFNNQDLTDKGRYVVTKNKDDLGKFKVPGLRNVAVTAPYMHNGAFKTLREVIDYYDNPHNFVTDPIGMDSLMLEPIGLTEVEKEQLEAFMHALTDDRFIQVARLKKD